MMIHFKLLWSACFIGLGQFHRVIIEYFKGIAIGAEDAPFLFDLIVAAEIGDIVALVMSESCLLFAVVPFYGTIAVAGYKIGGGEGFPFKRCGGVATKSGSVSDFEDSALENIVNFCLTVCASGCNDFVVWIDLHGENLCADVTEKVDEFDGVCFVVGDFDLAWVIAFALFILLAVEDVFHLFEGEHALQGTGLCIGLHIDYNYVCVIKTNSLINMSQSGNVIQRGVEWLHQQTRKYSLSHPESSEASQLSNNNRRETVRYSSFLTSQQTGKLRDARVSVEFVKKWEGLVMKKGLRCCRKVFREIFRAGYFVEESGKGCGEGSLAKLSNLYGFDSGTCFYALWTYFLLAVS